MEKRVSIKHKRKEAPEWVFQWRRPGNPALAKWLALLVTGGCFVLLFTGLRIRVSQPVQWAAPEATVILVGDDAEGRALALRAREGGPFPSRFLPSRWGGTPALEEAVFEAARWTPPDYVPALRGFPDETPPPVRLAARGVPVLPDRRSAVSSAAVKLVPVPVITPLSGIRKEEMPRDPPPVEGPVDPGGSWRFLVRLDAAGHVLDCVSLAGGGESGPSPIDEWLRKLTFGPGPGFRWIAVGVSFINQPAAHGVDAD